MKKNEPPITVTETFQCSAETLWQALSDVRKMRDWYFDNITQFEPRLGFKTRFVVENEGRIFTHCWEVTKAVPNEKLSYRWSYEEYSGAAIVYFLLQGSNPTRLLVTMDVIADFPDDITEFERASCQGGWDYFIGESLPKYIRLSLQLVE